MILETFILTACMQSTPVSESRVEIAARSMSPLPPAPLNPTNRLIQNERAALLGQHLFFDAGLSRNGEVSCATCHDPAKAFADGLPVAEGVAVGTINTPPVLGSARQRWPFLAGRADSLWSQALGPIENDLEMGGSRTDTVRHIAATPHLAALYLELFESLPDVSDTEQFPLGAKPGTPVWDSMSAEDQDRVTEAYAIVGKCIAAYEQQLDLGESPFDRWTNTIRAGKRDDSILPDAAHRGFKIFISDAQCGRCHFGSMLTDLEFHDLGLPPRDAAAPPHPGRGEGYALLRESEFRADGPWSDAPSSDRARRAARARIGSEHWGAFRTPSLRNVARTAPYMHSGQFETLSEVLEFYNTLDGQVFRHQNAEEVLEPLNLTPAQLADLEAFLITLSSDAPPQHLTQAPETGGTAGRESPK